MAKKKEAPAKSAGKKDAETKSKKASEPKGPRGKEIEVDKIDASRARKMLGTTHKLSKAVERARAALDVASKQRRAAKANHEEAVEALERELREQRFGPGPLFNADGTGASAVAQGAAS